MQIILTEKDKECCIRVCYHDCENQVCIDCLFDGKCDDTGTNVVAKFLLDNCEDENEHNNARAR